MDDGNRGIVCQVLSAVLAGGNGHLQDVVLSCRVRSFG